mgnify:CR=1 FL=1
MALMLFGCRLFVFRICVLSLCCVLCAGPCCVMLCAMLVGQRLPNQQSGTLLVQQPKPLFALRVHAAGDAGLHVSAWPSRLSL